MKSNEVSQSLTCFKTYDIRGKLNSEISEEFAYKVGYAVAKSLSAKIVIIGFDARATSEGLAKALSQGIIATGADVIQIGLAGTEEMYWGVTHFKACAGIEVTASHNPIDYNGMKIVKSHSQPLEKKEFQKIKFAVEKNSFPLSETFGNIYFKQSEARDAYIEKLITFVQPKNLKKLKILLNFGNGAAGPTFAALENALKKKLVAADFVCMHQNPDPLFPNGIPNPLLIENRKLTADAIRDHGADFGVAFDGDFDRCFFFDGNGDYINGEYIIAFLAELFLKREPKAKIVHDCRVVWNVKNRIKALSGRSIVSKTGHAFIKHEMRKSEAIYGGEMSGHHYFRDFAFCDSGMIPWLLVWEYLSLTGKSLDEINKQNKDFYPSSGELNFTVAEPELYLSKIKSFYLASSIDFDELDGLSMVFENWRFNLRKSNTEPLLRLNIETKGSTDLLAEKIESLSNFIECGEL